MVTLKKIFFSSKKFLARRVIIIIPLIFRGNWLGVGFKKIVWQLLLGWDIDVETWKVMVTVFIIDSVLQIPCSEFEHEHHCSPAACAFRESKPAVEQWRHPFEVEDVNWKEWLEYRDGEIGRIFSRHSRKPLGTWCVQIACIIRSKGGWDSRGWILGREEGE